jgi:hypothetical protein
VWRTRSFLHSYLACLVAVYAWIGGAVVHSTVLLLLLKKIYIIIYNNTWHHLKFTNFENIDSLPALISVYLSEFMPALLFVSLKICAFRLFCCCGQPRSFEKSKGVASSPTQCRRREIRPMH